MGRPLEPISGHHRLTDPDLIGLNPANGLPPQHLITAAVYDGPPMPGTSYLRLARRTAGLSIHKLAHLLNVPSEDAARWDAGVADPETTTACEWLHACRQHTIESALR